MKPLFTSRLALASLIVFGTAAINVPAFAQASADIFAPISIHFSGQSGYLKGSLTCTEINEYGTLPYSCKGGFRYAQSMSPGTTVMLSPDVLTPYHTKIKVYSVYLSNFDGYVYDQNHNPQFHVEFPYKRLDGKHAPACINVNGNGKVTLAPTCTNP